MFRLECKILLMVAVVAATLSLGASQADAFWGCGWGCGYGGYSYASYYTPYYSSCYTPACSVGCGSYCGYGGWYVGYRPGPIRRALFGPYRLYWSGYGCYDSCAYGGCATVSTCGVAASCCSDAGSAAPAVQPTPARKPVQPAPAPVPVPIEPAQPAPAATAPPITPAPAPAIPMDIPSEPAVTPAPPITPGSSAIPTRQNSGVLTVFVPYEAKVTVNGMPTRSKGSRRQFVSHGLRPGFTYKYEVRAEIPRDGFRVEEVRTVYLTAGDRTAVAFSFNPDLSQQELVAN